MIGRRSIPPADADNRLSAVSHDAVVIGAAYVLSFLYPLVSLPLLSRAFGPADFGRLVFALAVLQVVTYVVDYGFNISAMRRIALTADPRNRGRIVVDTLGARAVLVVVAGLALTLAVAVVPQLRADWELYALGLACIGLSIASPDWLLQGLGWVRTFAVVMALSRVLALGGLVATVHDASDLPLALVWQLLPLVIGSVLAWPLLLRAGVLAPVRATVAGVRHALDDGRLLFVSNMALLGMGAANAVVLGFVSTPAQVAYLGAAERFGNAGRGVMSGVQNVMLPRLTRADEGERGARLRRLVGTGIAGLYGLGGLGLVLVSPWFIPIYLGPGFDTAVLVTQLIGAGLCLAGGTAVFVLLAQARHRFAVVARITAGTAVVHIVLVALGGWQWGAVGAASAILLTEALQLALFAADHRRQRRRAASAHPTDRSSSSSSDHPSEPPVAEGRSGPAEEFPA